MLIATENTDAALSRELENQAAVARGPQPAAANPRQLIRNYILENFLFSDDQSAIQDDVSLLQLGIIDSVGALEIALFIEQSFGFAVRREEMLPENLDSVDNLVAFVGRRQEAG